MFDDHAMGYSNSYRLPCSMSLTLKTPLEKQRHVYTVKNIFCDKLSAWFITFAQIPS